MDQSRLVQQCKPVKQLLCKNTNEGCAKTTELVLLDQLVQIYAQQLEYQTKMLLVDERVLEAQKVVIIVLIEFGIELKGVLAGEYPEGLHHLPNPRRRLPSCSG